MAVNSGISLFLRIRPIKECRVSPKYQTSPQKDKKIKQCPNVWLPFFFSLNRFPVKSLSDNSSNNNKQHSETKKPKTRWTCCETGLVKKKNKKNNSVTGP
jgi:hypothetical protein